MNIPRKVIPLAAIAVLALVMAGNAGASTAGQGPTVIVHGVVATAELPLAVVLQDGTRVELAPERGLLFAGDPAAPVPGDEVVVVGRGSTAAGVTTVHSAGVIVHTPSGRMLPLPPDPCVVPSASLDTVLHTLHERRSSAPPRPAPSSAASAVSHDDPMELTGTVVSVASQSFRIQPEHDNAIEVFVDGSTRYMNLGSIADLRPGDTVRVTGMDSASGFLAALVELMNGGGGDQTEITGVVLSVASQSFQVQPEHGSSIEVLVDASTRYMNLDSIADLRPGDTVRVTGRDSGSGFLASVVEFVDGENGGHGGVQMESTGLLIEVLPPDGLRLDDGRTYTVTTATVYENGLNGYADLDPGQFLEIEGSYRGGTYTALKIELEGDQSGGQRFLDVEGTVTAVTATTLTVDGTTTLLVMPSTRFEGDADTLDEVGIGWTVRAHALLNMMDQLLAREIRSEDPAPATTENQDFEPHQALAVLAETADPQTVAGRHGAVVAGTVGDLGVLLQWDTELTDELLAGLTSDPEVLAVEPNYNFRDPESSRKRFPVVDRSFTPSTYEQQPATTQIALPAALARSDGTGTVVAIMDTGVEPCHPLIQSRIVAGGMDVVDGDLEPWETRDGLDEDGDGLIDEAAGHGTFVASIIALAAPGARILPYRVLDDDGGGTAYGLALALADAIDRRVDVINISLTYHTRSSVVDLLLEKAAQRGIVVVAAAGNDPVATLPFPAVDSHVLAVTALASDATTLADFADTSTQQPIVAAPGENVYGALDRGRYGFSSGTSMAAPFAAAGAALIKSLDPAIDPVLVDQALVQAGSVPSAGTWTGTKLDLAAALSLVAP